MENINTGKQNYTVKNNTAEFVYNEQETKATNMVNLTEHLLEQHHIIRVGDKELLYYNGTSYSSFGMNDCKYLIKSHLPRMVGNSKTVNEIYYQLITERLIPLSLFNTDENIINFNNGVLHLDSGTISEHSPDIYSTITIPCNYNSCFTFDDCPKFKKFIFELASDNDSIVQLLMEYIGVIVSNVYGYRYKKLLILLGEGNTGKSVLRSLIIKILGDENCHSIDIEQLNSQFGAAQINNKRMAGAGDMSVTKLGDIDIIKQLTGSDTVNANRKHLNAISFQYKGLLWFNSNKLPQFKGDRGKHVFERFIIVPCLNIIPENERNSNLVEELYAERDAIVSVAVQALKHSITNGYRFTECELISKYRNKYELLNNSLKHFISEYCKIGNGTIIRSRFNKIYSAWCNENGYLAEQKSDIKEYLESNYNITARKTGGGHMHYDLSIDFEKLGQIGQFDMYL